LIILLCFVVIRADNDGFLPVTDKCQNLKSSDCTSESGCNWCVTVDLEYCSSDQVCKSE